MGVDQQGSGTQRITYGLHRESMPAIPDAALQHIQRQPAGKRDRAAGGLTLKR